RLRQERFRARPGRSGRRGVDVTWPIPWVGRVGGARGRTRLVRALVRGASARVDLGPGTPRFVYGNADEGGYFRPLHDGAALRALAAHLDALTPVERMGLLDHQWALARAGRAPLGDFLVLIERPGSEPEAEVLMAARGPLAFLEDRLAPELGARAVERFRDRVARIFGPALTELGWDPAPREPVDTRVRRG